MIWHCVHMAVAHPLLQHYFDTEWGQPVHDDGACLNV